MSSLKCVSSKGLEIICPIYNMNVMSNVLSPLFWDISKFHRAGWSSCGATHLYSRLTWPISFLVVFLGRTRKISDAPISSSAWSHQTGSHSGVTTHSYLEGSRSTWLLVIGIFEKMTLLECWRRVVSEVHFWNIVKFLREYTVQQSRRQSSLY
jgi:hypothetical protein